MVYKLKIKNMTMTYCIIVRGPLGAGKTAVAKILAKKLEGKYVSIDSLLAKNRLDKVNKKLDCIPVKNFIKAAETIIPKAKASLKNKKIIIFDGNFYHRKQISHLKKRLNCRFFVFTLKASLNVCIDRDRKRKNSYGRDAVKAVYRLTSSYGTMIDAENKAPEKVAEVILKLLKNKISK